MADPRKTPEHDTLATELSTLTGRKYEVVKIPRTTDNGRRAYSYALRVGEWQSTATPDCNFWRQALTQMVAMAKAGVL